MIYRESNSRYIAIKYSVRGRDLGSTVEEAIREVTQKVKLPEGYRLNWAGEYESQKRSERRLLVIVPITILLIFLILYTAFGSYKWCLLILLTVVLASVGGIFEFLIMGAYFSFSFGVGFLVVVVCSIVSGLIIVY